MSSESSRAITPVGLRYARWWWIPVALISMLALIAVPYFIFSVYVAHSFSMSPTISEGEYFLVSDIAYRISSPSRGDVIAFRTQHGIYVGRIVGMSGDHIQMREGKLYLNGVVASLKYDGEISAGCAGYECPTHMYVETLPGIPGHRVIAPGAYGPYGNTEEFIVPSGAYFVLFDNRESVGDSRFSGFVLSSSIIGKALCKLLDGRTQGWEFTPI